MKMKNVILVLALLGILFSSYQRELVVTDPYFACPAETVSFNFLSRGRIVEENIEVKLIQIHTGFKVAEGSTEGGKIIFDMMGLPGGYYKLSVTKLLDYNSVDEDEFLYQICNTPQEYREGIEVANATREELDGSFATSNTSGEESLLIPETEELPTQEVIEDDSSCLSSIVYCNDTRSDNSMDSLIFREPEVVAITTSANSYLLRIIGLVIIIVWVLLILEAIQRRK